MAAANNDGYFNVSYKLNENGKIVAYGGAPEDYLTDVIAAKAVDHIRRFSAEGRSFFLYVATFAPHSPYNPAPRHKGMFKEAELPRPPSFNEADVSDKPGFIQELPRLNQDEIAEITTHHRQRLECLQAVDELVETLVDTLEDTGELERTDLVYASDNGFHLGEHRMKEGKDTAYEEDIRVPLAIRGPGIPNGRAISGIALNIDLAPTFAACAGIKPPDFVDGRPLLPLLADPSVACAGVSSSSVSVSNPMSVWSLRTRSPSAPHAIPTSRTTTASARCTISRPIPSSSRASSPGPMRR
jgi:N-acetylglucosamine-6-sulfatase